MDLDQIKEQLHARILQLRSIEYTIMQEQFEKSWKAASKVEKEKLNHYILTSDKIAITNWESLQLKNDEQSTTVLRDKAKNLKIDNYSRKTRNELLMSLEKINKKALNKLPTAVKINYLKTTVQDIYPELSDANIPKRCLRLPKEIEKATKTEIDDAFQWIKNLRKTAFAELLKVRELLSPEIWKRYRDWGISKNREMVLLEWAQAKLRRHLMTNKRPKLFKKGG